MQGLNILRSILRGSIRLVKVLILGPRHDGVAHVVDLDILVSLLMPGGPGYLAIEPRADSRSFSTKKNCQNSCRANHPSAQSYCVHNAPNIHPINNIPQGLPGRQHVATQPAPRLRCLLFLNSANEFHECMPRRRLQPPSPCLHNRLPSGWQHLRYR